MGVRALQHEMPKAQSISWEPVNLPKLPLCCSLCPTHGKHKIRAHLRPHCCVESPISLIQGYICICRHRFRYINYGRDRGTVNSETVSSIHALALRAISMFHFLILTIRLDDNPREKRTDTPKRPGDATTTCDVTEIKRYVVTIILPTV